MAFSAMSWRLAGASRVARGWAQRGARPLATVQGGRGPRGPQGSGSAELHWQRAIHLSMVVSYAIGTPQEWMVIDAEQDASPVLFIDIHKYIDLEILVDGCFSK